MLSSSINVTVLRELWLLVLWKLCNYLGSDMFGCSEETVLRHYGRECSVISVGDGSGYQVIHDGVVHLALGVVRRRVFSLYLRLDAGVSRLEGGERLRGCFQELCSLVDGEGCLFFLEEFCELFYSDSPFVEKKHNGLRAHATEQKVS